MLKLDNIGHAYEVSEYDHDHSHDRKPLRSVGYVKNVEFSSESQAVTPFKRKLAQTSFYIGKDIRRMEAKKRFSDQVYKEQSLGFSGTNTNALEAALRQGYDFNPEQAYLLPIRDYPQYVDKKYSMAFNGAPQMGLDLNIDWQSLVDKAVSGTGTGLEELAKQGLANLIPGTSSSGQQIIYVQNPSTGQSISVPASSVSKALSPTMKYLIIGGIALVGLVGVLLVIRSMKK